MYRNGMLVNEKILIDDIFLFILLKIMNDYHYVSTCLLANYIKMISGENVSSTEVMRQAEVDFPRTMVEYNFLHYCDLQDFLADVGYNNEVCKVSTHCVKLPSLKYLLIMLTTQVSLLPVFKILSDIYTDPNRGLYLSDFTGNNKLKIVIVDDDQGVLFNYFKKFRVYDTNLSLTILTINCKFSFCMPYYCITNDDHCLLEWEIILDHDGHG